MPRDWIPDKSEQLTANIAVYAMSDIKCNMNECKGLNNAIDVLSHRQV